MEQKYMLLIAVIVVIVVLLLIYYKKQNPPKLNLVSESFKPSCTSCTSCGQTESSVCVNCGEYPCLCNRIVKGISASLDNIYNNGSPVNIWTNSNRPAADMYEMMTPTPKSNKLPPSNGILVPKVKFLPNISKAKWNVEKLENTESDFLDGIYDIKKSNNIKQTTFVPSSYHAKALSIGSA